MSRPDSQIPANAFDTVESADVRATDKAVILAAGLGTRMRKDDASAELDADQSAVADTGVKALIPIKRPFLDYVLHTLADAGYRRVCLVIGPDHHEIRRYYEETIRPERLKISFAIQASPRGTADAVACAETFVAGDRFIVLNSDNFYPSMACRALRYIRGSGLAVFDRDSMLRGSNIPVDRVLKFAVAKVSRGGVLERIIEKPDQATVDSLGSEVLLSMNCWMFTSNIFRACRAIAPSARGELEITDAVQYAIDQLDERFQVVASCSPVLDLSTRADVIPVTERLRDMEVSL